jgi:hypothetical protein
LKLFPNQIKSISVSNDDTSQIQLEKHESEAEPEQLYEGDDAHADAEAQEASHLGQEVNPGHGGLSSQLGSSFKNVV